MSNRPAPWKQASVKRAITAVLGAGLSVERIDFAPDGTIRIIAGSPNVQRPVEMTELERWKASRGARSS